MHSEIVHFLVFRNAFSTYLPKVEKCLAFLREAVSLTAAKINETRSAVSNAHGSIVADFNSSSAMAREVSRIILLVGPFHPIPKSAQGGPLCFHEFPSLPTHICPGC